MAELGKSMRETVLQQWQSLTIRPLLGLTAILFAVAIVSSVVRIGWVSHEQLELAQHELKRQHYERAIICYQRSIQAYLPWLPYREQSIKEMTSLLPSLEQQGNRQLALEGWRRLRGALLSTRSIFGQPDKELLTRVNRDIARLAAATDTQNLMSRETIEKESLQLLEQHPKDINNFWGFMNLIALLLWVGTTGWLIWFWQGLTIRHRTYLAGSSVGFWLLWLASLHFAG